MIMGRSIQYKDSIDLLGVSVTGRISERNVKCSPQKFYCRVNSVLYDFIKIPCEFKAKLFDSYCLDVYGSLLWNYKTSKMLICCYCMAGINSTVLENS